jgi:hypothetical protein
MNIRLHAKLALRKYSIWVTSQRSWLRHYTTSRKVAGSDPNGAIEIFNLRNPSSSIMAMRSTQPPTEMNTKNLPGGRGLPELKADYLTAICDRLSRKCLSLNDPQYYGL